MGGPEHSGLSTQFSGKAVIVSYGLWQRRYRGDRAILGKPLLLDTSYLPAQRAARLDPIAVLRE